jgi:hypothetical protein
MYLFIVCIAPAWLELRTASLRAAVLVSIASLDPAWHVSWPFK